MLFSWQMVPRYRPEVTFRGMISAAWGRDDLAERLDLGVELAEGENLHFLTGGTAGLAVALRALGLPPGSGVGVPIYACVSVFEAVAAAGHKCVFHDLDPETFLPDLDSLRSRRDAMAAAVVIHLFGYPVDLEAVRGVLGDRPIVEDCTQALGSRRRGRSVGLEGAAGVFSFNFHKPVSAGGGGFLVVNESRLRAPVREAVRTDLRPRPLPGPGVLLKRSLKGLLYRAPWYGLLVRAGAIDLDRAGAMSVPVVVGPMQRFERILAGRSLRTFPERIQRQREWIAGLCEALGGVAPTGKYLGAGRDWNAFHMPVLERSAGACRAARAHFRRHGVDAYLLWPECLDAAARFGYRRGECPRLEDALPRLYFLPCYASMRESEKRRVRDAAIAWAAQRFLPVDLVGRFELDHKGYWTTKALRIAARRCGFDRVRIVRRERGFRYPWQRKALHWTTQWVSHLTAGLVDLATVFHAELWKDRPR